MHLQEWFAFQEEITTFRCGGSRSRAETILAWTSSIPGKR